MFQKKLLATSYYLPFLFCFTCFFSDKIEMKFLLWSSEAQLEFSITYLGTSTWFSPLADGQKPLPQASKQSLKTVFCWLLITLQLIAVPSTAQLRRAATCSQGRSLITRLAEVRFFYADRGSAGVKSRRSTVYPVYLWPCSWIKAIVMLTVIITSIQEHMGNGRQSMSIQGNNDKGFLFWEWRGVKVFLGI